MLKAGVRIYEVPISYYGRTYEEGKKIGWKDGAPRISGSVSWFPETATTVLPSAATYFLIVDLAASGIGLDDETRATSQAILAKPSPDLAVVASVVHDLPDAVFENDCSKGERHAVLDECFAHNDHLRANGHLVAEVPLQPPETALTLYWKNGKVATTDGPYAETKEQLGGIQILEARDLNHAIQLVSQLPGFKYGLGPVEIRPVADLSEIIKESERRRRKDTSR